MNSPTENFQELNKDNNSGSSNGNIPEWKKIIYEKRNEKHIETEAKKAAANYVGEPEWRRIILKKRDERKAILEEERRDREEMEKAFTSAPKWQQELILKKYEKYHLNKSKQSPEDDEEEE